MATILTTFLLMRIVNAEITGLSIFALNLIIGLGLGLAIDYSLFVVSRFREELERAAATPCARSGRRWGTPGAPCCSRRSPWPPRSRR
jgi:RND superfamily putative drug exporter